MKFSLAPDLLRLKRADVVLLALSFATAICDVATFNELGIFVSNQTGNMVFLALETIGIKNPNLFASRSVIAVLSFWFGSFLSGRLAIQFGAMNRRYLFSSFFAQAIVVLIIAILVLTSTLNIYPPVSNLHFLIIFPLAITFGMQAAVARTFGIPDIPTVVVTSAMVDFFSDPNLFKLTATKNLARNRRLAFVLCFYSGGLVGAAIIKRVGSGWALVGSGICKLMVAGSFLFLESEPIIEEDGKTMDVKVFRTNDSSREFSRNTMDLTRNDSRASISSSETVV